MTIYLETEKGTVHAHCDDCLVHEERPSFSLGRDRERLGYAIWDRKLRKLLVTHEIVPVSALEGLEALLTPFFEKNPAQS